MGGNHADQMRKMLRCIGVHHAGNLSGKGHLVHLLPLPCVRRSLSGVCDGFCLAGGHYGIYQDAEPDPDTVMRADDTVLAKKFAYLKSDKGFLLYASFFICTFPE